MRRVRCLARSAIAEVYPRIWSHIACPWAAPLTSAMPNAGEMANRRHHPGWFLEAVLFRAKSRVLSHIRQLDAIIEAITQRVEEMGR